MKEQGRDRNSPWKFIQIFTFLVKQKSRRHWTIVNLICTANNIISCIVCLRFYRKSKYWNKHNPICENTKPQFTSKPILIYLRFCLWSHLLQFKLIMRFSQEPMSYMNNQMPQHPNPGNPVCSFEKSILSDVSYFSTKTKASH